MDFNILNKEFQSGVYIKHQIGDKNHTLTDRNILVNFLRELIYLALVANI